MVDSGDSLVRSSITRLTRPVVRRTDNLIIKINEEGLFLRGHRKRKWHYASWERVLSLFSDNSCTSFPVALMQEIEVKLGSRIRDKMEKPCRPSPTTPQETKKTPVTAPSKE